MRRRTAWFASHLAADGAKVYERWPLATPHMYQSIRVGRDGSLTCLENDEPCPPSNAHRQIVRHFRIPERWEQR